MRILSIDPGHSTGIAVFNAQGEYEFSMHITDEAWNGGNFILKLVALAKPDMVLLEGIPSRQQDPKTVERFTELKQWLKVAGYPFRVILPGQWKGLTDGPKIPGQHARDAAKMAMWWMGGEEYESKTIDR